MEEAPRIEGYVKPKIKEKDNLTSKTLTVYYIYMLLPIKNIMQGKKRMLSFQK